MLHNVRTMECKIEIGCHGCSVVMVTSKSHFSMKLTVFRVAKFRCPCVLDIQKISEDNKNLRPGCPPDYQFFCERIDHKIFIPTNLSSYLSLTNKNRSMRTSTTYMLYGNKMRTTKIMTKTTRF